MLKNFCEENSITNYFEVSSKDGTNVNKMFEKVAQIALENFEMKKKIPEIKRSLAWVDWLPTIGISVGVVTVVYLLDKYDYINLKSIVNFRN